MNLEKMTPKTRRIIKGMVKKFCEWNYSPMAQCDQPDFQDRVFRAAEWLAPKLMKLESARPERRKVRRQIP